VSIGHKISKSRPETPCQIKVNTIILSLSEKCQKISLRQTECSGHCPGRTFFYGEKEINRFQCCKLNTIKKATTRIYCQKMLNDADLNFKEVNSKQTEDHDILLNSFDVSKWIPVQGVYDNFSGYYNVDYAEEAVCSCQNL